MNARVAPPGGIVVLGAGAVGCVVAAHLIDAGRGRVACAVRTPFAELDVTTPTRRIRTPVACIAEPQAAEHAEFVLLATKAHQTESAAPWLRALASPASVVAILQNGVEHVARAEPHADGAALVPVVVECPATRTAPGRVLQRAKARLVVPDTPPAGRFASLFDGSEVAVERTADFTTAAWRKLCVNVAGGALTALTGRPLGVVHEAGMAELARGLVRECIAVGRAEGAGLPDALADEIVAALRAAPRDATTSLLKDRRAGRALEVDARNGAVARIGARHGIAAPLNASVTAVLAAGVW